MLKGSSSLQVARSRSFAKILWTLLFARRCLSGRSEYESQILLQAPQQDMLKGSSYLQEAGFRPFAKILSSGGLSGWSQSSLQEASQSGRSGYFAKYTLTRPSPLQDISIKTGKEWDPKFYYSGALPHTKFHFERAQPCHACMYLYFCV